MDIRLLIFDLDGTLVDSRKDLVLSVPGCGKGLEPRASAHRTAILTGLLICPAVWITTSMLPVVGISLGTRTLTW